MTPGHPHTHDPDDELDRGLGYDLPRLMGRRRLLGLLAGAGLLTATACAGGPGGPSGVAVAQGSEGEIPQETAGPYPGEGSNGPNVLTESGVVRSDIRSSFGTLSGTAEGIPLTLSLTVTDLAGAPMPGAAVYVWHCDRAGDYSLYTREDQNYLRGVQVAGQDGAVAFTSIFPGCYSGRWPHVHFEVFSSLDEATSGANAITTSQLAFPQEACAAVYATAGYEQSVENLSRITLASDTVFSDGVEEQMAAMTGSVGSGYTAALTVPVA
ncbi:intradiol ring-cleavage dioxygenase [Pseudonocardia sp.]|uniref:intradiol ring-cleavage dioxygenase n=1 Tax=Pseudonocardia sp. TaxID=60912 RepID=UPI003D0BF896